MENNCIVVVCGSCVFFVLERGSVTLERRRVCKKRFGQGCVVEGLIRTCVSFKNALPVHFLGEYFRRGTPESCVLKTAIILLQYYPHTATHQQIPAQGPQFRFILLTIYETRQCFLLIFLIAHRHPAALVVAFLFQRCSCTLSNEWILSRFPYYVTMTAAGCIRLGPVASATPLVPLIHLSYTRRSS